MWVRVLARINRVEENKAAIINTFLRLFSKKN
jgi:hypothetical protein